MLIEWSAALFGKGLLNDFGRSALPNWRANFSDPVVGFWFKAKCIDERLCSLLRTLERRHHKTIDGEVDEERREKFGLAVTNVGKHRVVDAASVDFPLRLSVSNEDQFHGEFSGLAATGSAAMAIGPTATMPMPTKVGSIDGHGDDVAGARRDVPIASGAYIVLCCFVGLHASDLDFEAHWVAFGFAGHVNRRTPK